MSFSKVQSKIYLSILFLINFFWYIPLRFNTLMGDDLNSWWQFQSFHTFLDATFLNAINDKYRPVWDIFQYGYYRIFDHSYLAIYLINIFFNGIILYVLFHFLYRLYQSYLVSFGIALLYLLSSFSYYNIQQLYGLMEQIGILLLILILYCVYLFETRGEIFYVASALFLYNLIIYVHERYLALFPFLFLLILGTSHLNKLKKWILLSVSIFIPVFNYFLKTSIFHIPFAEGTSGTQVHIQIIRIVRFFFTGLLNLLGFNIGPEYLNGLDFSNIYILSKIGSGIVAFIFILVLAISVIELKKMEREQRLYRMKLWVYVISLIGGLVLVSSITIRVEMRWIYSVVPVLLLVFAYFLKRIKIKNFNKGVLIFALIIISSLNNIYFRQGVHNLFFDEAQQIADSAYSVTIEKYGTQFAMHNVYIIKNPALDWPLLGDTFFKQYLSNTSNIHYVDSLKNIPPNQLDTPNTLIYQYKSNQLEQLTNR